MGRAGLCLGRRGPEGGHRLARPPGQIRAGDVVRAVDGPLGFAGEVGRAEDAAAACLRALWQRVEQAVARTLDGVTLDDLRQEAGQADGRDFSI